MQASLGFASMVVMRFKRVFDVLFVLLISVPAFLLCALIAVWIKASSLRSPVFYCQERVGRFGNVFLIYKFRTMAPGAEQGMGAVWSPLRDPRVTRVGRILRRYRLDELPQLINVLKGNMSLVGPRPERPELAAQLEKEIPFYRERENIPPGLTGWAQIRHPYGASVEDSRIKLEYDMYYLQNLSFGLDLQIILRTLRIVLFGMEREMR
jgi:lipopolysaccharide/colanic/teichoic acid biosynthesis glycosyltransferase